MPRRPAPSPLRLVQGPLPLRGKPKHTLPSLPRPVFHPPARLSQGPVPRERTHALTSPPDDAENHLSRLDVTPLALLSLEGAMSPTSSIGGHSDGMRSRTSLESSRSSGERSRSSSPPPEREIRIQGPWVKHARSFSLPIDINTIVVPPQPVAINPLPVW
ncbi:uncharacterized protein FIBRA_05994 [Fibroporia radiculosa]|uniref:Uncharacterized protein n=1 Tax=Fibroporia radiculosa TaxID=599839 RepID=J4GRZ9_9APHY|nr:uncharacterized protein FIBRA_05994 [Fibroporia radiculosa]CCM03845.1 predicted protein [Fibroporia radiculosa]